MWAVDLGRVGVDVATHLRRLGLAGSWSRPLVAASSIGHRIAEGDKRHLVHLPP